MGNDQPLRQIVRELIHDRCARQTMKAVTLHTLQLQLSGNRQDSGNLWQIGVKGRVETGDMRQPRKRFMGKLDQRQRLRHMERRERGAALKLLQHRMIEHTVLAEPRPPMHDAMTNGRWRRQSGLGEESLDVANRFPRVAPRCGLG